LKDKRQSGTGTAKKKVRKYEQSPEFHNLLEQVDEWRASPTGNEQQAKQDNPFEGFEFSGDEMRGCFFNTNQDYCHDSTAGIDFKYGFTNNEFIYWLAVIDPIEFIIVVTVFSIIFCEAFNLEELFVVVRFITSLRDGIDIIMNQRINQRLVCDIWNNKSTTEEEEDETEELKQELAVLKQQYAELHSRLQGVEATSQQSTAFSEPTQSFDFGYGALDEGGIDSGPLAEDNLMAWTNSLNL